MKLVASYLIVGSSAPFVVSIRDQIKIDKIVSSLNLKVPPRDARQGDPRAHLSAIFTQWLPLAQSSLGMCVLYTTITSLITTTTTSLLPPSSHHYHHHHLITTITSSLPPPHHYHHCLITTTITLSSLPSPHHYHHCLITTTTTTSSLPSPFQLSMYIYP